MEQRINYVPALCVLVLMVAFISCNQEKKEKAMDKTGETAEKAPVEKNETNISPKKEYLNLDLTAFTSLEQGDRVEITNTQRNTTYTLKIRRVQETIPGLVSIAANIDDRETGLATLILREGKLSGTLELYKDSLRFRVAYDSAASQHYLTEVKPEDLDQLEGSKPLNPPGNN